MELQGASVLVTGGASGLGEATVRALVSRGAHVVIADRQVERGTELAKELEATFAETDVSDEEQVHAAVEAASRVAPLRVLVNCAGISRAARTVSRRGEPFDLALFNFVLQVNLVGTFNCIRLAAQAMSSAEPDADGQRGVIVNTASAAAFEGQVGQAAYSASKGGIVAMTLPIARDLAVHGIRINTIAPGLFDTPIFDTPTGPDLREQLAKDVVFPLRAGRPAEFAAMVVSIVDNPYLNGETIRLDGASRLPPG